MFQITHKHYATYLKVKCIFILQLASFTQGDKLRERKSVRQFGSAQHSLSLSFLSDLRAKAILTTKNLNLHSMPF